MTLTRNKGLLALAGALVAAWYAVRIDGALRPVARAVTVTFPTATLVTPTVYSNDADRGAVYVVVEDAGADGRFDARRVELRTGARSQTVIAIGPRSGFVPFTEGDVQIEVDGLSLRRPAFHLFRLPDGGGPGIHLVRSDTGAVRVTARHRTLLARRVFNSSTTAELRSLVSTDAAGDTVAVAEKTASGWTLHLFDNTPEES